MVGWQLDTWLEDSVRCPVPPVRTQGPNNLQSKHRSDRLGPRLARGFHMQEFARFGFADGEKSFRWWRANAWPYIVSTNKNKECANNATMTAQEQRADRALKFEAAISQSEY